MKHALKPLGKRFLTLRDDREVLRGRWLRKGAGIGLGRRMCRVPTHTTSGTEEWSREGQEGRVSSPRWWMVSSAKFEGGDGVRTFSQQMRLRPKAAEGGPRRTLTSERGVGGRNTEKDGRAVARRNVNIMEEKYRRGILCGDFFRVDADVREKHNGILVPR